MNNPNEVRCERDRLVADLRQASLSGASARGITGVAADLLESDAKRIAELEGCVAALRKDAERYRWLKESSPHGMWWSEYAPNPSDFDELIDLAIARERSASDTPMAGKEKVRG